MTGETRRYGTDRTGAVGTDVADGSPDATPAEVLELLGDEYTRVVLEAVLDRPRSGAEVANATGVSRATAFRRLNELVEFGLVTVQQRLDPEDGHHHKQYLAVIDGFSVTFGEQGVEMRIETDDSRTRTQTPPRVPADD
jgi:predicted ArsR family transcriptional regulator